MSRSGARWIGRDGATNARDAGRRPPVTDDIVEQMADEAERGYDVAEIRRRRSGSDLLRAAKHGVSVSEAPRGAGEK
jgi:hypothetical protein